MYDIQCIFYARCSGLQRKSVRMIKGGKKLGNENDQIDYDGIDGGGDSDIGRRKTAFWNNREKNNDDPLPLAQKIIVFKIIMKKMLTISDQMSRRP